MGRASGHEYSYVLGLPDMKAAALAWSEQSNSATVYALVGNGISGGVIRSTDAGTTWSELAPNVVGDGRENVPATVPRLVGRLIALDEGDAVAPADKRIYVGSADGLWRVSVNSGTAVRIALDNLRISSVALHPTYPDTLWVSVPEGPGRGVYKVTGVAAAGQDLAMATKLVNPDPETPVRPWV